MKNVFIKYGKWALVTGASSGIGKAMVERICSEGLNCFLVSNEEQNLTQLAEEMNKKYGCTVVPIYCDLSKANFIDIVREKVADTQIDVLVNCASFGMLGSFYKSSMQSYRDGIEVGVMSYVTLTYEYLYNMIKHDRGAIILVSSVNAFAPIAYSAIYSAEKAFELSFGEAIYQELKYLNSNVDMLTICTSATKTNFQKRAGTRVAHWAWEPEKTVDIGLRQLGKKSRVVLSWRGKVLYWGSLLLPEKIRLRFASWAITSNLAKEKIKIEKMNFN